MAIPSLADAEMSYTTLTIVDDVLQCPLCGEGNLHQSTVEIFTRNHEDGTSTILRMDDNGIASIAQDKPERNPSSRRQGMRVHFWCEECSPQDGDGEQPMSIINLEIFQHKGVTFMRWEAAPD